MFVGTYRFEGDPTELLAAYDRLIAVTGKHPSDLHVCIALDDGLLIIDSCPSREVFLSFSSSESTLNLMKNCGLPAPTVEPLGEPHSAFLTAPVDP